MAYVDLNPVRAGIAATPEESDFISIPARIERLGRVEVSAAHESSSELPLLDFSSDRKPRRAHIPFGLRDYLDLVDWSGRVQRRDKRGAIDERQPPIGTKTNDSVPTSNYG